jgi:long-subunit acyl-CoA synthetase (AMP-forming)
MRSSKLRSRWKSGVGWAVAEASSDLSPVEKIKRFAILCDDWLPGGDEPTPTMKLKRKPIARKYAERIEALYG